MEILAGTPPDWRYCQYHYRFACVTHENNQYKQDRTPFVLIQLRPYAVIGPGNLGSCKQAREIITHVSNSLIRIEITVFLNVLHRGLIQIIY